MPDVLATAVATIYVALTAATLQALPHRYRVVFSLAELATAFTDRVVLIADSRDGAALSAHEGPFRLVVPGEKREARWVRQVTAIDVEDAPE